MFTFLHYPKCTTCKKAGQWLDEHGVAYTPRDIKTQPPALDELRAWYQASGLPLKRFFNTSGLVYKSMGLKNKLSGLSEEEQLMLLASDGMLVRRPILTDGSRVLVGFSPEQWVQIL